MSKRLSRGLRRAVSDLGPEKVTGALMWPDMEPDTAGDRLSHAIDDDRRERLKLGQIDLIWINAHRAAKHEAFITWAKSIGYAVVAVLDESEQIADLVRRAETANAEALSLSTEAIARMKATHLKVDE